MLTSEHTAKVIEQKARKVLGMLKRGVKFMPTQPNVLSILEQLKHGKRVLYTGTPCQVNGLYMYLKSKLIEL